MDAGIRVDILCNMNICLFLGYSISLSIEYSLYPKMM